MTFSIASYIGVMLSVERFLTERIEGAPQLLSLRTALVLRVFTFSTHCVQGSEFGGGGQVVLPVFICLSRP